MWTQKEALLKGTGRGLAGSAALGEYSRWVTLPLQVAGGYVAAVALEMRGEIPEDGGEALTVRLYTDVEG
jgi:4'-phosphopantetheinyl transferase